jgi:hypothetical protein
VILALFRFIKLRIMALRNSNNRVFVGSLESISLLPIIERAEQIRPINKEDGASENHSNHSGETSNSAGTIATSHLTDYIPAIESTGAIRGEENPSAAAGSR